MGNAAWGHGYHKGFGDGVKQGGALGSLATISFGIVIATGIWASKVIRARQVAKFDLPDVDASEMPSDCTDAEGVGPTVDDNTEASDTSPHHE